MNRRSFIRNAGLMGGSLLIGGQALPAFPASGQRIRIGIIGCGDRGKGIMEVLGQLGELFEITAICDVLDFRVEETKRKFPSGEWKIYKDHRAILDDKGVDAVVIATPLNTHFEVASAALAAGKHLYLEKTMTWSTDQAFKLVALSKQRPGQILLVGHQYRFSPLYNKVREMIGKGYLGKVTQIDCRWDRNGSWRRPVPDPSLERKINWRMYREYSGGLPAELLSHQFDFINLAFGTHPDEIFATGGIDYYKDGRETYDNVQVTARYARDGMIGNFGATCGNARDGFVFKLKGTKGTISLLPDTGVYYPESQTKKELETVDGVTGATKIEWNKDGGIPILKETPRDSTWYALGDFFNAVRTGQQPASNVVSGATTAICVHLSNQSLFGDTIQQWKPAYNLH